MNPDLTASVLQDILIRSQTQCWVLGSLTNRIVRVTVGINRPLKKRISKLQVLWTNPTVIGYVWGLCQPSGGQGRWGEVTPLS